MKKIIFIFVISLSLTLSGLIFEVHSAVPKLHSLKIIPYIVDPVELWREYVLTGDQWYLIIHYDDGSIGAFPKAEPPVD
jgi:hypothetical protein